MQQNNFKKYVKYMSIKIVKGSNVCDNNLNES